MKEKVIVGVSGGVDSAVSLYLLQKQGYDVLAVTMEIYKGEPLSDTIVGNSCYGREKQDLDDVKRLCEKLNVPCHIFDCSAEFNQKVLSVFKNEYMHGRTPNPCILCNRFIKFDVLPAKAKAEGIDFDYFATGHYVRTEKIGDRVYLQKATESARDQSYFLWQLSQEQLERVKFPLGELTKTEVRKIAAEVYGWLANKKDSSDFYGGNYEDILQVEDKIGDIVLSDGTVLGHHKGFWHYTLGQRKGLGIAYPTPLYVVAIDAENNRVVVGEATSVMKTQIKARDFNFYPFADMTEVPVYGKVRSTQKPVETDKIILSDDGFATVFFKDAVISPAPSQSLVLYQNDCVIGGGFIV